MASLLLFFNYRSQLLPVTFADLFDAKQIAKFFDVNRDIMIRTFCVVCVYTFFTRTSAGMEDARLLAVNTILLQLFTLFSYMTDGFAYAVEALAVDSSGHEMVRCEEPPTASSGRWLYLLSSSLVIHMVARFAPSWMNDAGAT